MRVLVFSRTTGYRHESIPSGVAALSEILPPLGIEPVFTQDNDAFHTESLSTFRAVIWHQTTGDVLEPEHRLTYSAWAREGGVTIGIHAATVAEPSWPEFSDLFGARFVSHPPGTQLGLIRLSEPVHPTVRALEACLEWEDEWYDFDRAPGPDISVLATVDEASYTGGQMGSHHPVVWCRDGNRNRLWYTALGHRSEAFAVPAFRQHLADGIGCSLRVL